MKKLLTIRDIGLLETDVMAFININILNKYKDVGKLISEYNDLRISKQTIDYIISKSWWKDYNEWNLLRYVSKFVDILWSLILDEYNHNQELNGPQLNSKQA